MKKHPGNICCFHRCSHWLQAPPPPLTRALYRSSAGIRGPWWWSRRTLRALELRCVYTWFSAHRAALAEREVKLPHVVSHRSNGLPPDKGHPHHTW